MDLSPYIKIAFGHRAGVGKDMAANFLSKIYNGINVKFAEKVYEIHNSIQCMQNRTDKNRQLLQFIGQGLKSIYGDDIWINFAKKKIMDNPNSHIFVSDLRCKAEFYALKSMGFITVKIVRDSAQLIDHETERELDNVKFDYIIDNNCSLGDFKRNLITLIEERYVKICDELDYNCSFPIVLQSEIDRKMRHCYYNINAGELPLLRKCVSYITRVYGIELSYKEYNRVSNLLFMSIVDNWSCPFNFPEIVLFSIIKVEFKDLIAYRYDKKISFCGPDGALDIVDIVKNDKIYNTYINYFKITYFNLCKCIVDYCAKITGQIMPVCIFDIIFEYVKESAFTNDELRTNGNAVFKI